MTRGMRLILFWISVLVFFFGVLPLILFSLGYRFSFDEWEWLPAGGLSISSVPTTGSKIYVDDELVLETSLLSRRAFLQGLTPRRYHVKIEKEEYFPWEKTLLVRPEEVTDVRALLIKENQQESKMILQGGFSQIDYVHTENDVFQLKNKEGGTVYFSLEEQALLPLGTKVATSSTELPASVLSFIQEQNVPHTHVYDEKKKAILWWHGGEVRVRWLGGEEFLPLYTEEEEISLFREPHIIRRAAFHPEADAVIATFANGVFVTEMDGRDRRNTYPLYKGKEPDFLLIGEELFVLDNGNLIIVPLM